MFSRNPPALPKSAQLVAAGDGPVPLNTLNLPKNEPAPAQSQRPRSVIGNDLTIIGSGLRIVSAGVLQIDGSIAGDVQGAEVIIGEAGQLTGTVAAESVIVKGAVSGTIRGLKVSLEDKARVDGDIHHHELMVTNGAHFEGRSRRSADATALSTTLDAAQQVQAANAA